MEAKNIFSVRHLTEQSVILKFCKMTFKTSGTNIDLECCFILKNGKQANFPLRSQLGSLLLLWVHDTRFKSHRTDGACSFIVLSAAAPTYSQQVAEVCHLKS